MEDLLLKSEDVADAAVIGITMWVFLAPTHQKEAFMFMHSHKYPRDSKEYPRAYVVPTRPGVTDISIKEFVAARLAPYKRLTGGVVFCETIPKSPSGKILRRELRERAKKDLEAATSVIPKAKL